MENLQKELVGLINQKARDLVKEEAVYKDKYEDLESDLLTMITEAKQLRKDMVKHKLTASAIESEGYLRFALYVENLLQYKG